MTDDFFSERTEASEVKSKIVSKYFTAWSNVMKSTKNEKLAYIDLFCGPGKYDDGSESTPIIILKKILADPALRSRFVTHFNDANTDYIKSLKSAISQIPNLDKLRHKPHITNLEIGDSIAKLFERSSLIPTLAFVDPWGYKGLSLRLVKALTKDWGCDCIFFFNYIRVNAAITNPKVKDHIDSLFGKEKADQLRESVNEQTKDEREYTIINELAKIVSNNGSYFVLPFRFEKLGRRTSHYLIFVSKHPKGYQIMKDIMYNASSDKDDGVANFSYIPAQDEQLSILFGYSRPLDSLGNELLKRYSGRTMTMLDIFHDHNVGTPFVSANYKEALRRLEQAQYIITDPPADKRRNNKDGTKSFGDKVKVTFP